MNRPSSIARFEQLWGAATILWAAATWLSWSRTQAALLANPRTAAVAGMALPLTTALVLGATLLCWWLAARQGSVVGRWLVVVIAGFSILVRGFGLLGTLTGRLVHATPTILLFASALLSVGAALAVFGPDTDAWFGVGEEPESLA